ncbi:MAG: hypothetical protein WBB45_17130 [Cyclobacteriaceae bacterium]
MRSLFIKDAAKERQKEEEENVNKVVVKIKRRSDGTMKSKIRYKGRIKDGPAEDYYENGKLRTSIEYKDGLRHGEAKLYHKNGKLYRMTEYKDDMKNGLVTIYRKDGNVKATIPYKNDEPGIGTQEYYVSGNPKTEYPELKINKINRLKSEGRYMVEVELSEKDRNAVFYSGKLTDGKYINNNLVMLETPEKEVGLLDIYLPPGTMVNETINIIAVAETSMGNPYIVQKEVNINISN